MLRLHPALPKFYIFKDADGFHSTDQSTTDTLNKSVINGVPVATEGKSFYPQWGKPENPDMTVVAWMINSDGYKVVRYFWRIQSHSKACGRCKMVNDTDCAHEVPYELKYDPQTKFWQLANGGDAANRGLSKILDESKYN